MKKQIVILCILALCAVFHEASACSVMAGYPGTPQETFDRSETVFVGTVTSVVQDQGMYEDYQITFAVSKSYKGEVGSSVIVKATGSSAACGYDDGLNTFKKGTVWAVYADSELRTGSINGNKRYSGVREALADIDLLQEGPIACPMHYAPVCGRRDTGIRCVTTPCDSSEDKTYGNMCMLGADKAEFLYEGECRAGVSGTNYPATGQDSIPSDPTEVPTVFPTTHPDEEAIVSAWRGFWEGLKRVLFFWR